MIPALFFVVWFAQHICAMYLLTIQPSDISVDNFDMWKRVSTVLDLNDFNFSSYKNHKIVMGCKI